MEDAPFIRYVLDVIKPVCGLVSISLEQTGRGNL